MIRVPSSLIYGRVASYQTVQKYFGPEKEECSLQGKGWRSSNLLCGDHKLPPAIWKRQGPLALCGRGGGVA